MNGHETLQEEQKALLQFQLAKIKAWNFDNPLIDKTRYFLTEVLNDVRSIYVPTNRQEVAIPDHLLPSEITDELEQPYGRISIILGKGNDDVSEKRDLGKLTIIVQGEGPMPYDHWMLFFTLEDDSTRIRGSGAIGINAINVYRVENKYQNDEGSLLRIMGKLTKASLTQTLSS